jgi:hypothetical protein
MSIGSLATMGMGMMGGGTGGWTDILLKALQTGKSINDLVGPKGALVTGNIPQGISAGQNLYGIGQSLFGGSAATPPPFSDRTRADDYMSTSPESQMLPGMMTSQKAFGMNKLDFESMPKNMKDALLRELEKEVGTYGYPR